MQLSYLKDHKCSLKKMRRISSTRPQFRFKVNLQAYRIAQSSLPISATYEPVRAGSLKRC
jgi:hypothetical protein